MDWESVEHLFQDEYTATLIDRQVLALDRCAAACSAGVLVADLKGFSVVLGLATRAVNEHGGPFEGACCALIRVMSKVTIHFRVVACFAIPITQHSCVLVAAISASKSTRRTLCKRCAYRNFVVPC